MRLPIKPSQTPDTIGSLPSRRATAMPVASTSGAVLAQRTTSSSRMMFAGEKKCRPSTRSGRDVAAAMTSGSR